MEDRAINGDPRITLLHAYADEWNLQIDDIDEDDAGIYRCVINTGIYKTVALEVKGKKEFLIDIESVVSLSFYDQFHRRLSTNQQQNLIQHRSNRAQISRLNVMHMENQCRKYVSSHTINQTMHRVCSIKLSVNLA